MPGKSLLFLQLNEANFDFINLYAAKYDLPSLSKVLTWYNVELSSEASYEELEPWIQWVSVATGLGAREHGVFRLGDMTNSNLKQIYEVVEEKGYNVLALSPMNAKNNLKNSSLFLPDPWTDTPVSGGWLDNKIHISLKQAVNDNANGNINKLSIIFLLVGVLAYSKKKNWRRYFELAFSSKRDKWKKSLFLDLFLSDYFGKKWIQRQKPAFGVLFLNSIAHIQHRYFKNSEFCLGSKKNPSWLVPTDADPIFDALKIVDKILFDLLKLDETDLLIATGLSQKEYTPFVYYYRLKEHQKFLSDLAVEYDAVSPRMTRDFEITFLNNEQRDLCFTILSEVKIDDVKCFGVLEKRQLSLFVTLTYDKEVLPSSKLQTPSNSYNAFDVLSFVALKNGEHSEKSYAFFSPKISDLAPKKGSHVKNLYHTLDNYFR